MFDPRNQQVCHNELYDIYSSREQRAKCAPAADCFSCRISIKMASQPCGGTIGYETLFRVYLHALSIEKKWSGQETTEACDWMIGTNISDKWRLYAFGLIDISVCY